MNTFFRRGQMNCQNAFRHDIRFSPFGRSAVAARMRADEPAGVGMGATIAATMSLRDALSLFVERHVERPRDRGGDVLDVVGIDQQRPVEFARRAGKARQHQHAAATELLFEQIAVASRQRQQRQVDHVRRIAVAPRRGALACCELATHDTSFAICPEPGG